MYQIAAESLNQIARTESLKYPSMGRLFSMNQTALTDALEAQATALRRQGVANKVVLAYQTVAPLLMENEAISRYIRKTDSLTMRAALPEVTTIPEALQLAEAEHELTPKQIKALRKLLQREI